MTIQITNDTRKNLVALLSLPAEMAQNVIGFYAANGNVSADDLTTALEEVRLAEAGNLEKKAKKAANDAAKAKDEEVRALILAATSLEGVLEHVTYANTRKKRVWVNADGSFDTNLKASRQGNTSGKGRPKKDAPTGFQSAETSEEILGGIVTFVKDLEESDSLDDDLKSALYTDGGNMRSRDKVIAALLAANIIEAVEESDDDNTDS